jgi:hypothetical protein
MNRLIHYLLHESSVEAANEVSSSSCAAAGSSPAAGRRRQAGEFRNIDPVLFYTS